MLVLNFSYLSTVNECTFSCILLIIDSGNRMKFPASWNWNSSCCATVRYTVTFSNFYYLTNLVFLQRIVVVFFFIIKIPGFCSAMQIVYHTNPLHILLLFIWMLCTSMHLPLFMVAPYLPCFVPYDHYACPNMSKLLQPFLSNFSPTHSTWAVDLMYSFLHEIDLVHFGHSQCQS